MKTETSPKCLRCATPMTPGFMLDFSDADVHRKQALWVEGRPERSALVGTKLSGRDVRTVDAYRCPQCGLLELYALGIKNDFMI